MDEEIRKHAMLLFIGIVICAIVNVKLSSMKVKKIKKPMREKVALICEDVFIQDFESDEQKTISDKEQAKKNNDLVQISNIDYLDDDLSNKESWNGFLTTVYNKLVSQESVIVCVKPSNLAQISALIKGCFESVNKPIVIVSNEVDLEDAKLLISKLTMPYIVAIRNRILLAPEDVSNQTIVGINAEFDELFKKNIKPSSDLFLKRPNTSPTINILTLHPGMNFEKIVYCTLSYSDGIIIDNRADSKLRLDSLGDQADDVFKDRLILVVGKQIKVNSVNLQVLYDPNTSPEYALVKMFTN